VIYLLSGLLIIHGIVCQIGAFFPLYPPVFLFYAFFPGHFAVKLILVLLAGVAQLAYGMYLALCKRWRIRWYWPALATVIMVGLLLIFPAVQNLGLFTGLFEGGENRQSIPPKGMPPMLLPIPDEGAPDDIIPTADGPAYRANSHEIGIGNDLPPIESKEVVLAGNKYSPQITYRDYIETKAGEAKNNILYIDTGGRDISKLSLYTVNKPGEIEVTEGMRWERLGKMSIVLVIEALQDVGPGPYVFEIGVKVNGTDCGVVPCTINVVGDSPEVPYLGNHGITTTKVEPKPGDNVAMSSGLMIRLTLDDLIEKSDAIVIGKVVDIFPSRKVDWEDWEPWDTTTDVVIEVERYLYGQPQSPYIAVMVRGGRVGETVMWVEDEPVFNLGEEVALFLYWMQSDVAPPEGFKDAEYFRVTGAMQGKLGYKDGHMITLEGNPVTSSELEQKIAEAHEAEGEN